jgi:lipopolysaccharide export system permease protein
VTRFDRHIIARLLKGFLFLVAALVLFFIVLHWVEYSDDFMDGGATYRQVFLVFYPNYVPDIVRLISPLALFLSCIYLTSTLAQELQLIALQSSGVSLYRLLVPYAIVGVGVTVFMFGFNGWIVPRANETVVEYESKYLDGRSSNAQIDSDNIHRQTSARTLLSVGRYQRSDSTGRDVSLQHFSPDARLVWRLDAARMEWVDSLGAWRFENATRRTFRPNGTVVRTSIAALDTLLQVYPRDLARTERDAEAMTIPAAAEFVASLRRSGADQMGRTLVAYYNKFAYPVSNLVVILLGVPLASVRRRGGQATQFAIGLFLAFVYLSVQKLAEPYGYAGDLPPIVAAWLPHALFAVVALVLLVTARK